MTRPTSRAPYMQWAKQHRPAEHDLTGSNIDPVQLDELPGAAEALELSGPNDEGYGPLIDAIAGRYGVGRENVCTAVGTSGANFLAMAALVRPGDRVLIERPAYDPLLGALRLLGAGIVRFHRRFEDGFLPDPDEVVEKIDRSTRLVVLTNPHNPSGVLLPPDTIDRIAARAEEVGAHVLVDEVYLESVFDADPTPAAARSPAVISTNSLTKTWGLPGLRCGWAIADPAVAEAMRRVRDVMEGTGSFPSDVIATVAFARIGRLLERTRSILDPNRARLADVVEGSPLLEWVPPAGGTVAFPRVRGVESASPLVDRLYGEFGVGVVAGAFFESPAHIRIAIGGDPRRVGPALDALAAALRAVEGSASAS